MRKLAIAALLSLSTAGCGFDELILTESEAQDIADHFSSTVRLYQDMLDLSYRIAIGEESLAGYSYDPPTAANGWVGTVTIAGATLPSGSGDLILHFSVLGDGVPADPYAVDLSSADQVSFAGQILFTGISDMSEPVEFDSDFTLDLTLDGGLQESSILNGNFEVSHGDYFAVLNAEDFTLNFDTAQQAATSAAGLIEGTLDVPNYAFDADFGLRGELDRLIADISLSGAHIHDEIMLADF